MSVAEEFHQTVKALALARAREAATNAMVYASATTPGHRGFDYAQAPTESGLHKMRPAFVCCYEHRRECRPSGPETPCVARPSVYVVDPAGPRKRWTEPHLFI